MSNKWSRLLNQENSNIVMKLLLVKPPGNSHVIFPPIGLIYLGTSCEQVADVKILDCLKERLNHDEFEKKILEFRPNVVAITALSMEINSAIECARRCKKLDKSIITVLGGYHASMAYKLLKDKKCFDFIIAGESERSFPLFLEKLKKDDHDYKDISGLIYYEDEKIKVNPPELIEDLDSLPISDWGLIDLKDYPHIYLTIRHPSAPIVTTRGCPYSCTFCSAPKMSGKQFRTRSPQNVVTEIKNLYHNHGVREIMIWDDNFTLNIPRAKEICKLLIKENLDLIWSCPNGVRIDRLDKELIQLMKEAGCYSLCLGIESGSNKILKDMKKNLTVEKVKEIVPLIAEAGIRTQGFFIIGYPTETKEDILATIKLSLELPLYRASFSLFQPLPNTEAFDTFAIDKAEDINWDKMEYSKINIQLGKLTPIELKSLQKKAILSFYLRPRVLPRFLKENLSYTQFKELLLMFKKYVLGLA